MKYLALACDYDGTLAQDGIVTKQTLEAIKKLKSSGRKCLLITGRQLDDLQKIFPALNLFECVVTENGAVLHFPGNQFTKALAQPPRPDFIQALRDRDVDPLSIGNVIVATWEPNEKIVIDVIRDLGLKLQIIFNKGAVMILPSGVSKATGLRLAANELGLSLENVAGIGDAENDHAFLQICGFSAAVKNAIDSLKDSVDLQMSQDHGKGVEELIALMLKDDTSSWQIKK